MAAYKTVNEQIELIESIGSIAMAARHVGSSISSYATDRYKQAKRAVKKSRIKSIRAQRDKTHAVIPFQEARQVRRTYGGLMADA